MTYSLDLRKKALEYLKKGNSKKATALTFGVTTRSLTNWEKKENEGNLAPKKRKKGSYKFKDHVLIEYIQKNSDAYLHEISEHFKTTAQAIFYACKRLKITLKKRHSSTKKEMRKEEKNSTKK
ncbi:MAG: IS630 transposase-related protein [Rhabdochlamydiaceae bacterium]|nr:IS630 transposase-related protein [Candidatus Amphrikana amoebophyrae]